MALVARATFLATYHALVPVRDVLAHCEAKCDAGTFAALIGDPASAVFYAGADATECPVGFGVLTTPDFPIAVTPHDLEVRRIYTLATTHGGGLGGALLAAMVDDARTRRARRVLLGTHPDNLRARRFYEKHGFRVIGERRFQVGGSVFHDPVYALML